MSRYFAAAAAGEPDTTDTSIPHDELLEGFQNPTTGYENTWSETKPGNSTITVPADSSALTSNKPSGANNRCLKFVIDNDGVETFVTWDRGSQILYNTNSLDVVFYFYGQHNDANQSFTIAQVRNSTTTSLFSLNFTRDAGTGYTLQCVGASSSNTVAISPNTWVKVKIHLDTTAANCYMQIDDGTQETWTRGNNSYQKLLLGAITGHGTNEDAVLYFDLVCWNTP